MKKNGHQKIVKNEKGLSSPYNFINRKNIKSPLSAFHNKLNDNNYDIAFEITWTTLTPVAANPCNDTRVAPSFSLTGNKKDEGYGGYDKRWLTVGNRLAISPFTVKSAIANGFANLLGGCYRVNDREEGHGGGYEEGQYPYSGAYKRYRVSMDNKSKPGLLLSCEKRTDGKYDIKVQPVIEYYLDTSGTGFKLIPGKTYHADSLEIRHKNIIVPKSLREAGKTSSGSSREVSLVYYGPYRFGMDLTLGPGELRKGHYHRFYRIDKDKPIKTGTLSSEHFEPPEQLKKKVYLGNFKILSNDDFRNNKQGGIWYENLNTLIESVNKGETPWIYYEEFDNHITNIGKNFLFKALFLHEDAVPAEQRECKDHTKDMCPRCAMFGMTDDTEDRGNAIGFKGRFKAATLISNRELEERERKVVYNFSGTQVPLKEWVDKETKETIATQEFLPIMGPPKPSKRDIDGYFNSSSGKIKGAKYYLHAMLDSAKNIGGVDDKKADDYTHRLRNYAQVCKKNIEFTGTVGAENCNDEEIAALLLLLHSDASSHGFKIGLGKAYGMGTVKSNINKIWIRTKDNYNQWIVIKDIPSNLEEMSNILSKTFPNIAQRLKTLKYVTEKTSNIINSMKHIDERNLTYPSPEKKKNDGYLDYWKSFNQRKRI